MTEPAAATTASGVNTIEMQGIRHVYPGGTEALKGVDLQLGTGLFGLLGPNGAGKSTLMRVLCTLLVPTAGRARVAGYDVVTQRREVRRILGYLPQEFGAWRLQRVREVVDTLALLSGIRSKAKRRERVAAVLEQVGLDGVADRKVKKLSGGMVRRLGVAQALVHEPQVLIVDEPTVGLDPQERLRFRKVMTEMARDRTILLSTHIVADLGSGCRDLALIDSGEVVFRGSPAELAARARGKVFETAAAGMAASETAFEIVSRGRDEAGNVTIRAVAGDGRLPEGARAVDDPTLEEAYLAFMASRGRRVQIEDEAAASGAGAAGEDPE